MNSNQNFIEGLSQKLSARYPILYLETFEYSRVYDQLRSIARLESYHLFGWNIVDQMTQFSLEQDLQYSKVDGEYELAEGVLGEISRRIKSPQNEIFVLEDFHDHIEQAEVKVWLRKLGEDLKFANGQKHIILLSPHRNLPKDIEKFITMMEMPLPGREGLRNCLQNVARDAEFDSFIPGIQDRLIDAGLGMTILEADLAYCLAWEKEQFGEHSPDVVMQEKEQIIKKSGILEFFRQQEAMSNIGGLKNLKNWLDKRGVAFSPAARQFHLSEPKGIMLLGVPGCGKSLAAKAIASQWNMPLLRLDIGKVFEGLVGSSEGNIRLAIRTAEAVAPCILWIDEIEKGLAGTSSSGSTDSGVTARVFSTLLTWMQEKQAPVFVVATANGIEHLPPELLRKGRFDGIFFVDLPTEEEREEIFAIHLKRRNQPPERFALSSLAKQTVGFNGAEIEEVVNDALFAAFQDAPREPVLKMAHLNDAISSMVILATTMRERIDFLRTWSEKRASPAGTPNKEPLPSRAVELAPQERIRNRTLKSGG